VSEKRRGRRKQFDGPPVSVRMTQQTYDRLATEAFERRKELSEVIRERLDKPNSYPKYRQVGTTSIH
jgi:predicted nucleotidyltransferase